ncbi:NmrA family transcriptional regulator [Deinococcus aetherius]|uniref:NmrA family transcriptional regulator n=1 Tax=Deinococcus aetherius TaxID=200252 RepID=A0ABN6REL9_9DEIO|nr:SDR family oxidoreductase [Deinococcus aetherius]BDP41792.1 NmrA family transcriptional regulator [Deinococcus aetherius]
MIFLTGVSGQLSGRIARLLLDRGVPFRASTRDPGQVPWLTERGVEVVATEYEAPGFADAVRGSTHLLLLSTPAHDEAARVRQHLRAIQAAREAGVERISYTSFLDVDPTSPFRAAATHAATEQALRGSGARFTILRPSLYLDSLGMTLRQAAQSGVHRAPTGDARATYVSRDDIAAVAAALLEGGGHEGEVLEITGSESLTQAEVAERLGRVTGREVRYEAVSLEEFQAGLAAAGFPPPAVAGVGGIYAAIAAGHFDRVTDVVERMTGQPATGLEAYLRGVFPAT